jgi:hypothetical protein
MATAFRVFCNKATGWRARGEALQHHPRRKDNGLTAVRIAYPLPRPMEYRKERDGGGAGRHQHYLDAE